MATDEKTTDDSRNPGGTYDGTKLFSRLTGGVMSPAEIKWTFDRLKALMAAGTPKDDAKEIVKAEAAGKPWEAAHGR
mgnify:FL=1